MLLLTKNFIADQLKQKATTTVSVWCVNWPAVFLFPKLEIIILTVWIMMDYNGEEAKKGREKDRDR